MTILSSAPWLWCLLSAKCREMGKHGWDGETKSSVLGLPVLRWQKAHSGGSSRAHRVLLKGVKSVLGVCLVCVDSASSTCFTGGLGSMVRPSSPGHGYCQGNVTVLKSLTKHSPLLGRQASGASCRCGGGIPDRSSFQWPSCAYLTPAVWSLPVSHPLDSAGLARWSLGRVLQQELRGSQVL